MKSSAIALLLINAVSYSQYTNAISLHKRDEVDPDDSELTDGPFKNE